MRCYDAKRIGRTRPAFWSFIGLCRDNGITVLDATRTDLGESVMGGVNGMLAEKDRATPLLHGWKRESVIIADRSE